MIRAVLWDFGGVVLTSPFEAFNRYETEAGLPANFIRTVNSTDPDTNAWARLERNDIAPAEFDELFRAEALSLGHDVGGAAVLGLLAGDVRPEMVRAIDIVKDAGYRTACLTNNIAGGDGVTSSFDAGERAGLIAEIMERFDAVLESSKVGCRKPEVRFYELACTTLGVEPDECVFLDDLGVNLKPAAAMGMTTIKVLNAAQGLDDLERTLGLALR